ncbi:hypothetical protein M422DRAFT_259496 [Sphaerobolus stellatus SS14]|uniref:Uncharacterized protein n=1 Tax=Sphaerobolus stellatus (strain SS14) TaxID=990650 RepID=A0A0C9U4N2_SPHS4|nr:hypothetical protein M422DRAFT_259496 [Sphaerobolus stellatus SS14]
MKTRRAAAFSSKNAARPPARPPAKAPAKQAIKSASTKAKAATTKAVGKGVADQTITAPTRDIGKLSANELVELIQAEEAAELERIRAGCRRRKVRQADELEEEFTNDTIEQCHRRLEKLKTSGVNVSCATSDGMSLLPSITYAVPTSAVQPSSDNGLDTAHAHDDSQLIHLKREVRSPDLELDIAGEAGTDNSTYQPALVDQPQPDDFEVVTTNAATAIVSASGSQGGNDGNEDEDRGQDQQTKLKCAEDDEARPGSLMRAQLQVLRNKNSELEQWVTEKGREWNVSNLTITTNMGLDNRERRAINFWNIFQMVFWNQAIEEHEPKQPEGGEELDCEVVSEKCREAYAKLRLDREELTEKQLEEIEHKREEIRCRYEELEEEAQEAGQVFPGWKMAWKFSGFGEEELHYRQGNTGKLMRQARKELSMRAQWFALRGVLIGGFAVSIDYLDPVSHTLNFTFAGNQSACKFFDNEEVNMAQIIYDFETYCREGELKECQRGEKYNNAQAALRYTMENQGGDKRKAELANQTVNAAEDATGLHTTHLRWDEWAEDFPKKHKCLVGWPAEVTWPSGPAPYGSIDRGRGGKLLAEALLADKGREIRTEAWTEAEIKLAKSAPHHRLNKDPTWQCIPIVIDQDGNTLLTIGEMGEQTIARANFPKG